MLKGRSLLRLLDFKKGEIEHMLETSFLMKRLYMSSAVPRVLEGKRVVLLFEKPSTRTIVSSESAVLELGGHPLVLDYGQTQLSRGEPVEDTARVLGRMVNGIAARVRKHESLEKLRVSKVPVINLLSDLAHPLQALTDFMTIREVFGRYESIAFVGDGGDNVLLSLMELASKLGVDVKVASPKQLRPGQEFMKPIEEEAERSGAVIEFFEDPYEAVRGSKVVYTDVWVSMGQEVEAEKRKSLLSPYRVTEDLMAHASSEAIFMHCLPAVRGEEVEEAVLEGRRSVVWDQAENRLYTAMAVFSLLI